MKAGCFYFVSDSFFDRYDPQKSLMQNKEVINGKQHGRPCFFAFPDKENSNIYWLVPVSSRVEKYQAIVKKKIDKMIASGKPNPKCNTILFGELLGRKSAFLIQNMFPITENYISNAYIDKNTNNPLQLDDNTTKEIINNAKDVLKLHKRGIKLTYGNIDTIYKSLIDELKIREQINKLNSIVDEAKQILSQNPALNALYAKAEAAYFSKNPNLQRAKLAKESDDYPTQLSRIDAVRDEYNSVIISDVRLKNEYVKAKAIFRNNKIQSHNKDNKQETPPTQSQSSESKPPLPNKKPKHRGR